MQQATPTALPVQQGVFEMSRNKRGLGDGPPPLGCPPLGVKAENIGMVLCVTTRTGEQMNRAWAIPGVSGGVDHFLERYCLSPGDWQHYQQQGIPEDRMMLWRRFFGDVVHTWRLQKQYLPPVEGDTAGRLICSSGSIQLGDSAGTIPGCGAPCVACSSQCCSNNQ